MLSYLSAMPAKTNHRCCKFVPPLAKQLTKLKKKLKENVFCELQTKVKPSAFSLKVL